MTFFNTNVGSTWAMVSLERTGAQCVIGRLGPSLGPERESQKEQSAGPNRAPEGLKEARGGLGSGGRATLIYMHARESLGGGTVG